MRKIKKLSCIILAGALSIGALAFAACEEENKENPGGNGSGSGNGLEITQQPLNKPAVPDGVELAEVTDFEEIEKCLTEINSAIELYYIGSLPKERVCTFNAYGNRQIETVLAMGEDIIDDVEYTNVDSVKRMGREFSADMKFYSAGEERAADFNYNFIKTQSYKDNVAATTDYSNTERQDYRVNFSKGYLTSFLNGDLLESYRENFNNGNYKQFSINSIYKKFFVDMYSRNNDMQIENDYLSEIITNARACNSYNKTKNELPIQYTFSERLRYADFDCDWRDGYLIDGRLDDISWNEISVEKHNLQLKTNKKQYWLDLDIELNFIRNRFVNDQRTKTKKYQYTLYLDTQPDLTPQDIEKEQN